MQWSAFDGSTLTIGRSRTKRTAARTRTITVPKATARELKAWRVSSGGRGEEPIVGAMTQNAMKLWGRRVLRPAMKAASGRADAYADELQRGLDAVAHVVD